MSAITGPRLPADLTEREAHDTILAECRARNNGSVMRVTPPHVLVGTPGDHMVVNVNRTVPCERFGSKSLVIADGAPDWLTLIGKLVALGWISAKSLEYTLAWRKLAAIDPA